MAARGLATLAIAVVAVLFVAAPSAHSAEFGITDFDGMVADGAGGAATQAGSHPESIRSVFSLDAEVDPFLGRPVPPVNVRRIVVDLPPGLVGNPTAMPECTMAQLTAPGSSPRCPANSQVGVMPLFGGMFGQSAEMLSWGPLYNVEPPPGAAAAFGTTVVGIPVVVVARVRADGSVRLVANDVSEAVPVVATGAKAWGVPADPGNDVARQGLIDPNGSVSNCMAWNGLGYPDEVAAAMASAPCDNPASTPRKPFLTLPTSCTADGEGMRFELHVTSWRGETDHASFETHEPAPDEGTAAGVTGCERLAFDPDISAQPTSTEPDAPTGLDVEVSIPQPENPDGLAPAHLRHTSVTLPEGMTLSPSSADGLQACTDDQLRLGSVQPAGCPAASKIGSVEVDTPVLDEQLRGSVFVRTQSSDDPASGEMFRIAIEIRNDARGIDIKLPGNVSADPATGRLTATFANAPQVPFSSFRVHFKGGPRAPLANSPTCGTKTVSAVMTPWSGTDPVEVSDSFTLDCATPRGFEPSFEAGVISPTGGAFSPFVARIRRQEGQEYLSGVSVRLPEGLLARLGDVELCPDAVAGDGTPGVCPAGSRIGQAIVGAGSGSPYYLTGDAYLTGPYKGAPYGLSVQVHAKAGPYDLGMVKVRQALHVNPNTTQVRVVSDPLPQVVKGVIVRLRDVSIEADRPDFTVTPTSCEEMSVDATLTSLDGTGRHRSSRFQVGDCASLGFRPRLGMRLFGPRQRRTGGHPALKAVVRQGTGQANISRARVVLPRSIALDAENSNDPELLCDFDAATVRAECPESTVIGRARAVSPLLKQPLVGPVHLVQGIRVTEQGNRVRTTPGLLVKLHGEVDIDLHAKSTARKGLLISRFLNVPDARVSRFALRINGGPKGILVVTRTRRSKIDLCDRRQTARVRMAGHNDRNARFKTRVRTPCGRKGRKAQRRAKAKRPRGASARARQGGGAHGSERRG